MGSQMLLLNWNDHKNTMISEFQQLFSQAELMDVTLACDGFSLQAHKMVLSASSKFFRNLFLNHPCKHAIVVLTDVDSEELKAIVDFIYQGRVHIAEGKLTKFLATAEKLKIRGLSTIPQDENIRNLEGVVNSDSRSEPLKHVDITSSEKQLERENVERNEEQILSLNEKEMTSNVSVNYEIVKKESFANEQLLPEQHNDNLLEPDFSQSINEILASTNVSQNQCSLLQPVKPVSQEPMQWPPQMYQTDVTEKCLNSLSEIEEQVTAVGRRTLIEACESSETNNIYSFQIHRSQEITASTTEMSHLNSLDYICSICKKTFNSRPMLLRHQTTHTEELPFHCDVCSKRFKSKQGMKFHMMGHAGAKPYSCSVCDRKFSRQHSVEVHKRIHTDETENNAVATMELENSIIGTTVSSCFSKNQNDTSNPQISKFQGPVLEKSGKETSVFQCSVCRKIFNNRVILLAHQSNHIEERPYRCSVCSKRFQKKQHLTYHFLSHSGEKPYSCSICGRKFSRQHSLALHQRIHTGEKPYICSFCKKRFSDKTNLVVHVRKHTGEKPFYCHLCMKSFSYSGGLKAHMSLHDAQSFLSTVELEN